MKLLPAMEKNNFGAPAGFEDLLADMEGTPEESEASGAEMYDDLDKDDDGDPYQPYQESGDGGEAEESGMPEYEMTDQEIADLFAMLVDIAFSIIWGIWSKEDSRDFRLDARARKDLSKASKPIIARAKGKLDPEWLLFVTVLALQLPNGIKAFDLRDKNTKKAKTRQTAQKYANADPVEVEIISSEQAPPMTYGRDGKKQPTAKKCSNCGRYGHTKPTCPYPTKEK